MNAVALRFELFEYQESPIRIVWLEGKPWWVATDLADVLGYRDAHNMVRMLKPHQKGTHLVSTLRGDQSTTVVSEGGVFKCIMRSKRPEAEQFETWVTDDLLPTLFSTGRYMLPTNDNGLAALHPLLQTPEGRDALWKGREQIRLMKELKGKEAALALWIELRLPIPKNLDAYLDEGRAPKRGVGPLIGWITDLGVKTSVTTLTSGEELYDSYLSWCFVKGFSCYDPNKFRWHLRNNFTRGIEARRGLFALQITMV